MSRPCFLLAALLLSFVPCQVHAAEPKPRNPRVLFIVEKDCERCEKELARLERSGGDFEAMRSRGWKIGDGPENHVQIVDRESVFDLIDGLEFREYPTVVCIDRGEIVRSFKEGCTTPLDAWTFGFLLKGENERPKGSISESARVKTTNSYPLRGNHWSIEGDSNPSTEKLITHLRGPNHGHQIAASQTIETWSYEELRSLHDDLHEREIANGTAPASMSYSSNSYSGSQSMSSGANQFSAGRKMFAR
jgi:hypothetical protein